MFLIIFMKLLFIKFAEQWPEMRNRSAFFRLFSFFFERGEIKNWPHPQGEPGSGLHLNRTDNRWRSARVGMLRAIKRSL